MHENHHCSDTSNQSYVFQCEMVANQPSVSRLYHYFFLFIEPVSALTGAYYSFFQQQTYLDLTHSSSAPKGAVPVSTQVVLSQLANLYLFFAINEALILRATSDLQVWRTVLLCLLIADLGHLYSVRAVGWNIYWDVLGWNAIDWGNVAFVYVGALMRLAFLLGIGVGQSGEKAIRRSNRKRRPSSRLSG